MTTDQYDDLRTVIGLLNNGEHDEADDLYFSSVADCRPKTHQTANACVLVAISCRDYDGAYRFARRSVKLNPRSAQSHLCLGLAQSRLGRVDEAIASFRRSTKWDPELVDSWNNLAMNLENVGKLDEALDAVEKGLALESDDLDLNNIKGSILCSLGRPKEGIAAYRAGLASDESGEPDNFVRMNLGEALLQTGDFDEGWKEFAYRREMLRPPALDATPWEGQDLAGKSIAVWHEQGLGDTVHFCRYLPALVERAESVTFVCQERLLGVIRSLDADVELTGATYRPFDFESPLLELARHLDQPAPRAYLTTTGTAHEAIRSAKGYKVGVVASGNQHNPKDLERSIAERALKPLLDIPDVSFFDLGQWNSRVSPRLKSIGYAITDLEDLAATINALDLVISVDTLAAHLAGALGKPVWNLLAFSPDWRWGLEGERTDWYPTMRLFRQPALGDWKSVIAEVKVELTKLTSDHKE